MQNARIVFVLIDESVVDHWSVREKLARLVKNGYVLQPRTSYTIWVYKPMPTAHPLHEFLMPFELPKGLYVTEELRDLDEISTDDIAQNAQAEKDARDENQAKARSFHDAPNDDCDNDDSE